MIKKDIEAEIREIQKEIIEIKKSKTGMSPAITKKLVTQLISEEWTQDRIEKIREQQ